MRCRHGRLSKCRPRRAKKRNRKSLLCAFFSLRAIPDALDGQAPFAAYPPAIHTPQAKADKQAGDDRYAEVAENDGALILINDSENNARIVTIPAQ